MTLANVLFASSGSKSVRNLLDANVMPSPCSVFVACVWTLLLGDKAWLVESLKGGKEVDNAVIGAVGGEKAADVWLPRFVFNRETICAGVTLTARADLTSATCLADDGPLDAFVVVESRGRDGPPVQVAEVDRCAKFDRAGQQVHDLMVCFHHSPWNFSDDVFLPRINLDRDREPTEFDKTCSVMGFGHLTQDGDKCNVLYTAEVSVGTSRDCGSQDTGEHNFICGAAAEHQESCAVDGGEPLLCRHNGSGALVHGICKQGGGRFSKFILLSYYREWLVRTVPGLVPSSGSQEESSSHREEGDTKSGGSASPEQINQRMDHTKGEVDKFPFLPPAPPVHIHHHLLTKEHVDRATPDSSEDTASSPSAPISPLSGDRTVSDVTASDIQNAAGTARLAVSSAVANQESSGAGQSVSVGGSALDPGLVESSAGDRSDPNVALSAATVLPSDQVPPSALPEAVNATLRDTSPTADKVPTNMTPVQAPPSDPATVAPPNGAETVMNVTVLLASLSDGWYLSNATHSAPHLSESNEKLDLDQLEKLISDNGALLNFSYVVDNSSVSGPSYSNRSVETSAKLLSPTPAKSGADSTNSVPTSQMKSTGSKYPDAGGKPGQVPLGSSKPQNVLPSDVANPVQEASRDKAGPASANEAPQENASGSATTLHGLAEEPPATAPPIPPDALVISPDRWDWLKKNGLRLPKNPLEKAKILGKPMLFKEPRHKLGKALPAGQYWNRQRKEPLKDSESSGFPKSYREKWAAQVMSAYRLQPPSNDTEPPRSDQSHKGVPTADGHVAALRFLRGLTAGRSRRSLPSKGKPGDTRVWRNTFDGAGLSGDTRHAHPEASSPTLTANRKDERQTPSSSARQRQPEGTFFGEVSSSIKTRLKRSGELEGPSEWKTLLADIASWPDRVGISASQLTPSMSFLTYINGSAVDVSIVPQNKFYHYFRLLRAFLPGGNFDRRIDMLKKKVLWGPPITYDEFRPLRPHSMDVQPHLKPVDEGFKLDEPAAEDAPESRMYEEGDEASTVAYGGVNRQQREVKNDILTTPGAGTVHGDAVSAELGVETTNQTAGGCNSSCHRSPNATNVSGQPDSAKDVGTIDTAKEITHSPVDMEKGTTLSAAVTGKESALLTVDTRVETALPTADTHKETPFPTVDTHKEAPLPTADTHKEAPLPTDNTHKETPLPTDNTHKETPLFTDDTHKETALPTADTHKEAPLPTDNTHKETPLSTDDTHKETPLFTDDTHKETALPTADTHKEAPLPTDNTHKETPLSTDDTHKETALPTADTRKESTIPIADKRKDSLSTGNKENDTLLFTTNAQKGTTLSKGSTQRETTGGGQIVSTPHSVDAGKQNLWPTVRRTIEIEEPGEDRYSTSFTDDDEKEALQVHEDQNQEPEDFYEKIKRLGAGERASAAQRLASILGVPLTLLLTWISMPQTCVFN